MYQIIHESLSRQSKALALLHDLLEEEYTTLLARDTDGVVALEFSVQELIRQLAVEKCLVIRQLNGSRVLDYAALLPEEQASALRSCFAAIDESEQRVSRQASRNAQLSLALLDQSSRNLQALTSRAMPPKAETYGRKGGMRYQAHPQAALISGRL
ncbi:flagellar protein FlgN [Desulfovibrio sp. ZJ200]|uniref:flagellar protein FlgN n=1 Tax=Desulfovibrio sp. ZJ200 TaxID=2709792 RepID=UPI0013EB923F|nr:flagellar protein FlgN [Desulfovibrio sp. ZJ200]